MDCAANFAIAVLSCCYITRFLFLERETNHNGPLSHFLGNRLGWTVDFPFEPDHIQPASLADLIRLAFFIYKINFKERSLTVKNEMSNAFTCYFCLSFWVSILCSMPFFFCVDKIYFIGIVLSIAFLSFVINSILERVLDENYSE